MFPGWQPGGLPAALEQLLGEAEDPSAGLAGCCMAEGKDCQVTLSPRTEGEQLLCVVPRGPGAGGPALEQLGSQLRECLGELHLSAQRLGQPLEQLQDRRWDGAYFTLQRGLYRLLRMTRHLELLQLYVYLLGRAGPGGSVCGADRSGGGALPSGGGGAVL